MSLTASQTIFEGNDLQEWIKRFRLEKLSSLFEELGVERCEDLADIYSDDSMILKIQGVGLKPLEYKRFASAPAMTRILIGQPLSPLLNPDTVAKGSEPKMYEGNDLQEWIKHFKLESLAAKLDDQGVSTCEDLLDAYADDDIIKNIQGSADPADFSKFKAAPALTKFLIGHPMSRLLEEPSGTATRVPATRAPPASVFGFAGGGGSLTAPMSVVGSDTAKQDAELERMKKELEKKKKDAERAKKTETIEVMKRQLEKEELDERIAAASRATQIAALKEKKKAIDVRKREISALKDMLKDAATVDLCFLMDCTGSMSAHMSACKDDIRSLVESIKSTYPDIALRLSFVGYRDHCDGANRLSIFPFALDKVDEFQSFVGSQVATGGGDAAEDVHGGLKVAADQDWKSATRVLYHIADAPCHGSRFHNGVGDDYPHGHEKDTPAEQLIATLQGQQVVYFFGKLNTHTDKMITEFNKIAGSAYITTEDCRSAGSMMTTITKSVTTTMSKSIASSAKSGTSGVDPRHLRDVVLNPGEPNWAALTRETMHKYAMTLPASIRELCDADDDFECVSPVPVVGYTKVADFAFAKGGLRAASKAMEIDERGRETRVVHKESLSTKPEHLTQNAYEKDLAGHRVATFLANEFNKVAVPRGIPAVRYVEASVCQFLTKRGRAYFAQEGLVDGEWEKYNSNSGYVEPNPSLKAGVDHSAVQAYSHWTHHVTDGKIMVVDCQGAFDAGSRTFNLTDPAVHCTDMTRFDRTNLGGEGMRRFFSTHKCNDHCRALGMPAAGR